MNQLENKKLPKVVCVGFNKCATRSIAAMFQNAGHKTLHQKVRRWPFPPIRIGKLMRENIALGRRIFFGVEQYQVFCDLIYANSKESYDGNTNFREVIRDYPDAILLLNFRDEDAWIKSRLRHGHGNFAREQLSAYGLENTEELINKWKIDQRNHFAAVRSFMQSRPYQLVEFNIDEMDGNDLALLFPDYNLEPSNWQDLGRSRGRKISTALKILKRVNAKRKSLLK